MSPVVAERLFTLESPLAYRSKNHVVLSRLTLTLLVGLSWRDDIIRRVPVPFHNQTCIHHAFDICQRVTVY